MKKVYVGMAVDFVHPGHIKIIEQARKLGEVTVGLLTDKAIVSYKGLPGLNYEQRKIIIENIKGVSAVVPQDSIDYSDNLMHLKPDYVVHGDDWKYDARKEIRKKVIDLLKGWNGELIEPPFSREFSATALLQDYSKSGVTPDMRRRNFRRLLELKALVRLLEVHNGLSARIVEKTRIYDDLNMKEFDAMWISSLADSIAKGKPDIQCVDFTSRFQTIDQVLEVTTKPLVIDGDNGGEIEQFRFMVKTLERLGVSAVIIEDKIGPKRNSLFGTDIKQVQDSIENFENKIREGKKVQMTDDFMIIARIESLILKKGLPDALKRASAYIGAGADGIMIHSKEKDAKEILEFCRAYAEFKHKVPLIVVPTTYSQIKEVELIEAGVNVVIYANHMIRSVFPAMVKTAESILLNERALESEKNVMPIQEIIALIPETG